MSFILSASPLGVDLTAIGNGDGTTAGKLVPAFAVGTKVIANDGVYQYLKALGTIAINDFITVSNAFGATSATTTTNPSTLPSKCGVANQAAFIVNQYGWFFVGPGLVSVNVAASCVQDVKLYTTAVAGVVDDSATTLINGLKLITTIVGAAVSPCVAECELGTVLA